MPMIAAHPRPMPLAANNGAWQSVHHNKKAPRGALFCLKLGGVDDRSAVVQGNPILFEYTYLTIRYVE